GVCQRVDGSRAHAQTHPSIRGLWTGQLVKRAHLTYFFETTSTPHIHTLSLHDALPISRDNRSQIMPRLLQRVVVRRAEAAEQLEDRESTRLNSSHRTSSYAVFRLKKKTFPVFGLGFARDADSASATASCQLARVPSYSS